MPTGTASRCRSSRWPGPSPTPPCTWRSSARGGRRSSTERSPLPRFGSLSGTAGRSHASSPRPCRSRVHRRKGCEARAAAEDCECRHGERHQDAADDVEPSAPARMPVRRRRPMATLLAEDRHRVDAAGRGAEPGSKPRPELVLDHHRRRARQRGHRVRPGRPLRCEDADRELAVGEVAVAATVSPVDGRADARNVVEGREPTRALQVVPQRVTLGVDVGPDVVRDLPRGVAHADATVEGRRADPHGPPAVDREVRAPEADEPRSEEHTSELQSLAYLVCRLLLEKKKAKWWYG